MSKMNSESTIGYMQLALAQISMSLNTIAGKIIAPHFPIFSLLTIRFFLAFILLSIYLAFLKSPVLLELKKMNKSEWGILILKSLCGGFIFNILVLYGLQYTSASSAGIVNSSLPAFVALFSFFILKERLTRIQLIAILLTAIGIILMSAGTFIVPKGNEYYGLIIISLAMIPCALFVIFSKLINKSLTPLSAVLMMNFINAILFLPFALHEPLDSFYNASFDQWIYILTYSVTGSLLFFILWYKGISRTSASTSALFLGIMPISTCLIAYFFLSETLSLYELLGMVCVIASIYLGTLFHARSKFSGENTLSFKSNKLQ